MRSSTTTDHSRSVRESPSSCGLQHAPICPVRSRTVPRQEPSDWTSATGGLGFACTGDPMIPPFPPRRSSVSRRPGGTDELRLSARVGEVVTCDATGSHVDEGSIDRYTWDILGIDAGRPQLPLPESETVSFAFTEEGRWWVELIVSANEHDSGRDTRVLVEVFD